MLTRRLLGGVLVVLVVGGLTSSCGGGSSSAPTAPSITPTAPSITPTATPTALWSTSGVGTSVFLVPAYDKVARIVVDVPATASELISWYWSGTVTSNSFYLGSNVNDGSTHREMTVVVFHGYFHNGYSGVDCRTCRWSYAEIR